MKEPQQPSNPEEFVEEAVPFDDVVKRLLAAKVFHRRAPELKPKSDEKPNDP